MLAEMRAAARAKGRRPVALVPSLLLAIGLSAGGLMAGKGFADARLGDRFVTVKGVSEREVEADLAVWTLSFQLVETTWSRCSALWRAI